MTDPKKYPFETEPVEELLKQGNKAVENTEEEITEEDEAIDDADGGYFSNEEDNPDHGQSDI
jgi:hypothetical protein